MAATTTLPQHMQALEHANDVRLRVAAFKRDTAKLPHHQAVLAVLAVLEHRHEDPLLGGARVRHLLMSIPRVGDTKARKLIHVAQIYNGEKRLRDMTSRQRTLLAQLLEGEGWKR
jgi:hypothetical protein